MGVRVVHVHLVRHGQSTWNREGRLQGQTIHPSLTALGRRQAATAAATLSGRLDGPAILWSSDLVRAAMTAAVIGTRLGLPVHHDEALREQSLGRFEGRLARSLTPEPIPPGSHVAHMWWGGGESTADVYRRVGRFMTRELVHPATSATHVVVVSHGDTIRVARAWLLGRGHRDLESEEIPNGSVTSVSFESLGPVTAKGEAVRWGACDNPGPKCARGPKRWEA